MGAILGLMSAAQLACCCGSTACSLCCTACPSCRNSTSTRIMYMILLFLTTIVCCICLAPGLQDTLRNVPFCKNNETQQSFIPSVKDILVPNKVLFDCDAAVGYMAVYRICFAVTCFFFLMSLMMIGVESSRDQRAGIQNGFWGLKYILIIAGVIGAFYIPQDSSFSTVWMYVGMAGGFLFVLIQLVLVIDFAHTWAENWVGKFEETESRGWYAALLGVTSINYILSIAAVVLLYATYSTSNGCGLNKALITFNWISCLAVSILSISPSVQEHHPRSGLLQSSVVSLYIMYLTWSALSNQPDKTCNPGFLGFVTGTDSSTTVSTSFDRQSIIGLAVWIGCVLYSSIRTANNSEKITMTDKMLVKADSASDTEQMEAGSGNDLRSGGHRVWDNEEDAVKYSWSFFHVMFGLATLYVMMTLTNWYEPNSSLQTLNANMASLWVKIVSSWMCVLLYGWTLVAPIVLRDRVFN